MHGEKSIARCEDLITASSSSSDADDHESLGVDLEQASEAHASIHNVGSSCAMPQCRGGSLYNGSSSVMPQCRGGPFTTRSIYPQVRDPMIGQPFNASLFCFHNDFNNCFKNNII
jgi:hypothetical protein